MRSRHGPGVRARMPRLRRALRAVLAAGLVAVWAAAAFATNWNVSSGNWSTGGNWTDGEPTAADFAFVDNGGLATIDAAGEVCGVLYIGQGIGQSGTVVMDGGSLTADWEFVGFDGTGQFTQNAGTNTVGFYLGIAFSAGSQGTYNLVGGALSAVRMEVGDTFYWTGGTLDTGFLLIDATGRFRAGLTTTLAADTGIDGGIIEVDAGHTFTLSGLIGPLSNDTTIGKVGGGTLAIAGVQDHLPGTMFAVAGGTLALNSDAGGSTPNYNVTVNVTGGARTEFGATQHLASLDLGTGSAAITPGGSTVVTRSLAVDASDSFLDVADGAFILDYPLGSSPLVQVTGWVRSGFTGGPGGWWDGPGIQSSAAANDVTYATALGVLDNTHEFLGGRTEFGGEALDADGSDILIKYTWWGDIDFDGQVTLTDYSVFLYYFFEQENMTPDEMGWWSADLDYDGRVTLTDYSLLLYGFLTQTGPLGAGGVPSPVPEPATLVLVALGALAALTRRLRRG